MILRNIECDPYTLKIEYVVYYAITGQPQLIRPKQNDAHNASTEININWLADAAINRASAGDFNKYRRQQTTEAASGSAHEEREKSAMVRHELPLRPAAVLVAVSFHELKYLNPLLTRSSPVRNMLSTKSVSCLNTYLLEPLFVMITLIRTCYTVVRIKSSASRSDLLFILFVVNFIVQYKQYYRLQTISISKLRSWSGVTAFTDDTDYVDNSSST